MTVDFWHSRFARARWGRVEVVRRAARRRVRERVWKRIVVVVVVVGGGDGWFED